jgi:hypothetical protein
MTLFIGTSDFVLVVQRDGGAFRVGPKHTALSGEVSLRNTRNQNT